jgi:hypothetical protein
LDSPPWQQSELQESAELCTKQDVKIIRKIGEGAFGEVSEAKVFPFGTVAVKWLKVCAPMLSILAEFGKIFLFIPKNGQISSNIFKICNFYWLYSNQE